MYLARYGELLEFTVILEKRSSKQRTDISVFVLPNIRGCQEQFLALSHTLHLRDLIVPMYSSTHLPTLFRSLYALIDGLNVKADATPPLPALDHHIEAPRSFQNFLAGPVET